MTFEDALRATTQLTVSTWRGGNNEQGTNAAEQFVHTLNRMIANETISGRRRLTSSEVDNIGLELAVAVVAGRSKGSGSPADFLNDAKKVLRSFS